MKTPEQVQRWRDNHHRALESLATNGKSGLSLWRALLRIERKAHGYATALCIRDISEAEQNRVEREIRESVRKAFGCIPAGFHLNRDPRGYALKIDPDNGANIPEGMRKDWGGYGILAAEID